MSEKIEDEKQRMLASKGAESVFILYLSVNRAPSFFKEKGGEHLFFTPSRQGLGDTMREERARLLADFDRLSKAEVIAWLESFCDLNTYEVSIRYCATAPWRQKDRRV